MNVEHFGEVVVLVSHPNGDWRLYGAFANGTDAKKWMDKQYEAGFSGQFSLLPLRNVNRKREHNDWWMSDEHQSREWLEEEFPTFQWDKYPSN